MTDIDPHRSVDDELTSVLLQHYGAERRLKVVVAELKSIATIIEDLAFILRQAPEGLCNAAATARLSQYPTTERLGELVQEARTLKMELQDLDGALQRSWQNF